MVQERPLPKSAIFVAIDPISAKASALFDELVSVSNVRFIFVAEGIDSHANYLKNRPHGLVAQMFSGDFGWLRRAADTISNLLSEKLPSAPGTFNLEAPPEIDPERRYSVASLSSRAGAQVMPLELKQISVGRYVVDDDVLEAFSECDFGVLLSFNLILSGPILRSNWGVWSFHSANTFRYRGRPGCFWEYIDGESFGMTLQRLSEEVDGGPVLAQRHLSAPEGREKTLDEIRYILGTLQLGMITEALFQVQKTGGTFFPSPDTAKSQYHFQRDADKLLPSLKYLLVVIRNLVRRFFRAYG